MDASNPRSIGGDGGSLGSEWKLTIHNPLERRCIQIDGSDRPLAADLTASWVRGLATTEPPSFLGFLDPNAGISARLQFIAPYQPGRIPVLFVHGLASSELTWVAMLNDLQADPQLSKKYQFWTYTYPTGKPFLVSAADLRRDLEATLSQLEARYGPDPALQRLVLVGHSMGGLMARLQVSDSGDALWNVAAKVPLEGLRVEPEARRQIQRVFFFQANPRIRRVVFIATPHRGSMLAQCGPGRIASELVDLGPLATTRRRTVVEQNEGLIKPWLVKKDPTSVDMLEPSHPLVQAIDRLPIHACVQSHSIIGTGCLSGLVGHPGDGVVPISSARLPGVESEIYVHEKHSSVQRSLEAADEVRRILYAHLEEDCGPPIAHPSTPEPAAVATAPLDDAWRDDAEVLSDGTDQPDELRWQRSSKTRFVTSTD
jgi:pimeloyl-ACP methyl ester carboxylesterase